jgi:hypothetical protein
MITLTVLSITPSARDWLTQTQTARVLNAFDRACNLINQDDAILALVTSRRGLAPFGVAVGSDDPAPFRGLSTESAVTIEDTRLRVGALEVDWSAAAPWNPRPDWPALRRALAAPSATLDELSTTVISLGKAGSLLELLDPPASEPPPIHRAFLARARLGAVSLTQGLLQGSLELSLVGAHTLAGLGGGLTPAGDDFIVGAMLAAWAGLYGEGAEALCAPVAAAVAERTTLLSAAYLRAAARGECTAHWHALFGALLQAEAQAIQAALQSLLAVGHTSGADALAGFLFSKRVQTRVLRDVPITGA